MSSHFRISKVVLEQAISHFRVPLELLIHKKLILRTQSFFCLINSQSKFLARTSNLTITPCQLFNYRTNLKPQLIIYLLKITYLASNKVINKILAFPNLFLDHLQLLEKHCKAVNFKIQIMIHSFKILQHLKDLELI